MEAQDRVRLDGLVVGLIETRLDELGDLEDKELPSMVTEAVRYAKLTERIFNPTHRLRAMVTKSETSSLKV